MIIATMVKRCGCENIKIDDYRRGPITQLYQNAKHVESIFAKGEELKICCAILGRSLPPMEEYYFYGDNAKEIAANLAIVQ